MPVELDATKTEIILGYKTWIGKRVELQVALGETLSLGDFTTVNDNCMILGNVSIERYCLLSCNIYISSGNHWPCIFPTWLIRDQDKWIEDHVELVADYSAPVHIEEDCWIGWGVFIKRGIYIGRGAILGAYTVVTHDVPPYSIQVGTPNREIRKRFDFKPPRELFSMNENDWPYFYAGFLMKQEEILISKKDKILFAREVARVILDGGKFNQFSLRGKLNDYINNLILTIYCNQVELGSVDIKEHFFFRGNYG
ncbi:acyltransferase [Neosynechococcus sphagnicola]|uniref:acyltransferase n=1 Tax=Neosynechococcus sphagnicola TaxID=1501145 RepID=UPI0009DD1FA8|nr:acyltransferase [Neosynechococcus sphagnicola]